MPYESYLLVPICAVSSSEEDLETAGATWTRRVEQRPRAVAFPSQATQLSG